MLKKMNQMRAHLAQEIAKAKQQQIAQLVGELYNIDEELSLINNYNLYLQDNSLVKYKEEYEVYQQYRAHCKSLIKHN